MAHSHRLEKEVARLNELLGRELGRNPYGEPRFAWKWSEDLFWPAMPTGRTIQEIDELTIPLIGGGEEKVEQTRVVPEYRAERQTKRKDVWIICAWMSPQDLIWGGSRGLGRPGGPHVSDEQILAAWAEQYPGADFPAKGIYFATEQHLPRFPGGPTEPNEVDTIFAIHGIRQAASMSFGARLADMERDLAEREAARDAVVGDAIRESFPAMLHEPGKKDWVSFPLVTLK